MDDSDQEGCLGLEFDAGTESDSDVEQEETCAQGKSAGKTVLAGSSSRDKHARKEAARVRRQDIDQMARVMDMEAEEAALEAGKLQPRTLEQLSNADPILSFGQKFSCREEFLVTVGEDCEKMQKFYTCRNTGTRGHCTAAGRGMIGHRQVNCVCRDDTSCTYSVKGTFFKREDDGGSGWKVDEYKPHTCTGGRPDVQGQGGKAAAKGKGGKAAAKGKSAAKQGSNRKQNLSAYTGGMLARAVKSTVISTGRFSKTGLKEVRKALGKHVNAKVSTVTAHRVREACVQEMYGRAADGASLLPAIAADMNDKGYFAKIHYATKKEMVALTVDSLQYAHNASQRKFKVSARKKFDKKKAVDEQKTFYDKQHKHGVKYVAGISFCAPAVKKMLPLMHTVTSSDGAHAHGPWGGHHYDTNMLDSGRHVVAVMTSIFTFNECKSSAQLHFRAVKECHGDGALNTGAWWNIIDGGKGNMAGMDEELPQGNAFLCTRHTGKNVKDNTSSDEASKYHQAVNATTSHKLKTAQDSFQQRTAEYIEKRKAAAKNMKVEVFPVKAAVRGNSTTNWTEGSHAANAPARKVPMHRAVFEFTNMHRERFFANRALAQSCEEILPPKVTLILEQVTETARKLQGEVNMPDPANQAREGKILSLSGTCHLSSNISGDRKVCDVSCSCGVPAVKGHPCGHNVKHALELGIAGSSLFHYKDTTSCWQEQYAEDAEWPPIFFDQNARADPQVRYPPLPVAKVGRPKGTKRIRRHDEGGPSGRPNKKARRV